MQKRTTDLSKLWLQFLLQLKLPKDGKRKFCYRYCPEGLEQVVRAKRWPQAAFIRAVLLKIWFRDLQHQNYLGVC